MDKNKSRFRPVKSLGQNFLRDSAAIEAIVEGARITADDLVVEIGPGQGALTRFVAQRAARVIAVELDKRLIEPLRRSFLCAGNVEIVQGDALRTDFRNLVAERGFKDAIFIGNLPYYITTPLLMKLIDPAVPSKTIVVMVQKEVAERVIASPGGRTYGALTVAVSVRARAEKILDVAKTSFYPVPQVDSAVLRLTPWGSAEAPVHPLDTNLFFALVKAGFGKRRKTLLNALQGMTVPADAPGTEVFSLSKEEAVQVLHAAGVESVRRAETLSLSDFERLSNALSALRTEKNTK